MEQLTVTKKEFYTPLKTDWIQQSGLTEADFLREVSFAVQHLNKSPYLQKAEPTSILKAVMNLAQVGLTLNPISKFAALVPRYNSSTKQVECVLEPMYQGLAKLLTDSGSVKSIKCYVVYEGDDFLFDYSEPDAIVKHKPYFTIGKEKGKTMCVYSKATLADGSIHCEIMAFADVCDVRDRSESYKAYKDGKTKSCIWVSDESEMCRKTVIKRHYKYLPKTEKSERLEKAIDLDNQINGFEEAVDFGMVTWIENMIHQAKLEDGKKESYLKRMMNLQSKSEAHKMIEELSDYQPIIGIHRTAHTVEEIGTAARNAADRDDFYERNK